MMTKSRRLVAATVTALALTLALGAVAPCQAHADEKNPWIAAGLNWFIPGAGYIYNGQKPLYATVPMVAGAIGVTYIEQIHKFHDGKTLMDHDGRAFGVMFAAILLLNTGLAVDAYQEAKQINQSGNTASKAFDLQLQPTASLNGDRIGLALSGSF